MDETKIQQQNGTRLSTCVPKKRQKSRNGDRKFADSWERMWVVESYNAWYLSFFYSSYIANQHFRYTLRKVIINIQIVSLHLCYCFYVLRAFLCFMLILLFL